MEKIKVLQILPELEGGGIERVVYNYLSYMDKSVFDLDIVAISGRGKEPYMYQDFKKLGVNIFLLPNNIFIRLFVFTSLLCRKRYNVVHAHGVFSPVYYLFIAKLFFVRVRISHAHVALDTRVLKVRLAGFLLNRIATVKLSCGLAAGEYLYGKKQSSKENFIVLNNAINVSKYNFNKKLREKVRLELGVENSELLLGCVARFTKQKNHSFLIDVFFSIKQYNINSKLFLIGDGEMYEQIKNKVVLKGLSDSIVFLGLRNDIAELLQAFDVFLLPSIYEGFSVAMIEAQAAGLPVITSENVSIETDLTNNVIFLPLNNNPGYWARRTLGFIKSFNRCSQKECLVEKGYDILSQVKFLTNIYISHII